MKTLDIVIKLHQNLTSPLLDVQVVIGNQSYVIDISRPLHSLKYSYDPTLIITHKFKFIVEGKKHYLKQFFKNQLLDDIPNLHCVIDSITVDGHNITPILIKKSKYYHDNNGSSEPVVEEYTDYLGYDGSIEFNMITPLFIWYLVDYEF